jgi:hypothetical protein
MDETHQRFAYRCLPLNIANTHGWEILCPGGFTARWNGLAAMDAIEIVPDRDTNSAPPISHFGHGVLTLHVSCLFRTDPGFDLFVTGPLNRPKDGIGALSGIVETDWSSYTFTMNWLFTRPNAEVRFERGEPYAHIFPVQRGALEKLEPELRQLSEIPELDNEYKLWTESRNNFNAELDKPGSSAQQSRWQKSYFRGLTPSGQPTTAVHQSRLRLKEFTSVSKDGTKA